MKYLSLVLILFRKDKFLEIFKHFYNLNLDEYISGLNFYLTFIGGYLIDISILGFLSFLAWRIYKKEKLKKTEKISFPVLFFGGLTIFLVGIYMSAPKSLELLNKINLEKDHEIKYEEKKLEPISNHKNNFEEYQKNGWRIRERKFNNGFEREGFYNRPNEKRYFYEYHFSDF